MSWNFHEKMNTTHIFKKQIKPDSLGIPKSQRGEDKMQVIQGLSFEVKLYTSL